MNFNSKCAKLTIDTTKDIVDNLRGQTSIVAAENS